MSEVVAQDDDKNDLKPIQQASPEMQPGFCSAYCTDKSCMLSEINKPRVKTSDLYATCNLPKRFEHPHWFNGYGCQVSKQHPLYKTSASEYGWYPPGIHSVPSTYYPMDYSLSSYLCKHGMYRNYSLNTQFDSMLKVVPCSDK